MLGLLTLKTKLIVAGVAALALAGLLTYTYHKGYRNATNALEAAYSEKLLKASEAARAQEAALQMQVDAARATLKERTNEIQRKDAAIASMRIDMRELRNDLGAYVARQAAGATSSEIAGLAEHAGSCARLLEEGRRLVQEFSRISEERGAEIDAVLQAWPKNQGPKKPDNTPAL